MPRRKKSVSNPRKPQLPFLENPLQGPVHQYGSPLQKAENPRYVPAKPLDQSTSTSWVSPQFDHMVDLRFPGRRLRRIFNNTLHLQGQPQKASESVLNASKAHRKQSVCKFPPLDFHNFATTPSDPSDLPFDLRLVKKTRQQAPCNPRSKNGTGPVKKKRLPSPLLQASPLPLLQEAAADDVFSPPDLQTPETTPLPRRSSTRLCRLLLAPRETSEASSPTALSRGTMGLCRGSELNSFGGTPERPGSFPVLVQDTPEHEYGVKITWRRRHELMKYLQERGKLKSSEILVKRGPTSSLQN